MLSAHRTESLNEYHAFNLVDYQVAAKEHIMAAVKYTAMKLHDKAAVHYMKAEPKQELQACDCWVAAGRQDKALALCLKVRLLVEHKICVSQLSSTFAVLGITTVALASMYHKVEGVNCRNHTLFVGCQAGLLNAVCEAACS